MTRDVPIGVGRTALGVALVRAMESRRRDRLFHDPYAAAFLAAAQAMFDGDQRGAVAGLGGLSSEGAAFWSHAVIRTRFFDDYLLDPTGQGIRQVVLLAAGLDTRAYRLVWPAAVRAGPGRGARIQAACPGRAGCRRDGTAPATRSAISSPSLILD